MYNCAFEDHEGRRHTMSTQPIIMKGILTTPIIVLDQSVKIGAKAFPKTILPDLINMISRLKADNMHNAVQIK